MENGLSIQNLQNSFVFNKRTTEDTIMLAKIYYEHMDKPYVYLSHKPL